MRLPSRQRRRGRCGGRRDSLRCPPEKRGRHKAAADRCRSSSDRGARRRCRCRAGGAATYRSDDGCRTGLRDPSGRLDPSASSPEAARLAGSRRSTRRTRCSRGQWYAWRRARFRLVRTSPRPAAQNGVEHAEGRGRGPVASERAPYVRRPRIMTTHCDSGDRAPSVPHGKRSHAAGLARPGAHTTPCPPARTKAAARVSESSGNARQSGRWIVWPATAVPWEGEGREATASVSPLVGPRDSAFHLDGDFLLNLQFLDFRT